MMEYDEGREIQDPNTSSMATHPRGRNLNASVPMAGPPSLGPFDQADLQAMPGKVGAKSHLVMADFGDNFPSGASH